jgi:hypothetical protein
MRLSAVARSGTLIGSTLIGEALTQLVRFDAARSQVLVGRRKRLRRDRRRAMGASAPNAQDRAELDLLLRGFQVSRMLRLVADLGVADRIPPDDALPLNDLASACSVLPERLIRVLRALAAFQIFRVSADGDVGHTPRSRLLRTDTPDSMHHAARFWTGPGSWKAWGMLDVAMTGATPHQAAWNMDRFMYLREHADEAQAYDAMMASFPDHRHAGIAGAYDFSSFGLIADIGGGNGATLRHILKRFPGTYGQIFDREDVIGALTPDDLMQGRISARAGNFFAEVPTGADAYLLVRVLHNWNDDDCLRILGTCRKAMGPGATLLLGEEILEPDPTRGESTSYLIDMQMMAMFGHARARSEAEFHNLLERSGFVLRRVIGTESLVSIVEATPGPTT